VGGAGLQACIDENIFIAGSKFLLFKTRIRIRISRKMQVL